MHLDGALRTDTLFRFAEEQGRLSPGETLETFDDRVRAAPGCTTLEEFLKPFDLLGPLLSAKGTMVRAAHEVVVDLHAQGVIHAEPRFAPSLMTSPGRSVDDVVDEALEGLRRGIAETGMSAGLILCIFRAGSPEDAASTVRAAIRRRDHGVVGIDLAGPEACPAAPFLHAFRMARDAGLGITLHAGEACGPENIAEAVDAFGATRIGHGLTLWKDPALLARLVDADVAIESCPTSNIHTGQVRNLTEHPFRRYLDAGAALTLSTDDPSLSRITSCSEWAACAAAFGLDRNDFLTLNRNAIRHAFVSPGVRAALERRLETPT